jgi:hypothetical protein
VVALQIWSATFSKVFFTCPRLSSLAKDIALHL